ncbi:hypothetical protein ABZ942_15515 [Nocardia sp. NPDC046473]|uniref:hypothetical protein n=1 Tax=Nocardia sp. NPDC046473 TaxID=3155733 RepID=UPI0033F8D747
MNPMHAMHGPEFHPGWLFQLLAVLPASLLRVVLVAAVLVGVVGCTAAMIAGPKYPSSPNYCRADQVAVAAQVGCEVRR